MNSGAGKIKCVKMFSMEDGEKILRGELKPEDARDLLSDPKPTYEDADGFKVFVNIETNPENIGISPTE